MHTNIKKPVPDNKIIFTKDGLFIFVILLGKLNILKIFTSQRQLARD